MRTAITLMERKMMGISFVMIENVMYMKMDIVIDGNERSVRAFKYEN